MKCRSDVFDPDTIGVYHVFSRCVQKLPLLGYDPYTGTINNRRRDRAVEDLQRIAKFYAFDVLDFSLMENHLHALVRNRPDIAEVWPDWEVATRWWYLHPNRLKADGSPEDPTEEDLRPWLEDKAFIETLRLRLCDLSWFMWEWLGKIGRDCNREAKTDGRFFSRRFKCKKIKDLGGLLACSMYVILNPSRAGMVENPEDYLHSSLHYRVAGHIQRQQRQLGKEVSAEDVDGWLATMFLDERAVAYNASVQELNGKSTLVPQSNPLGSARCSNKGYVTLELPQFIDVAHWTAENVRKRTQAAEKGEEWSPSPIPREMEQMLREVGIPKDRWCTLVEHFEKLFHFYVGTGAQIAEEADRLHQKWLKGKRSCETYLGRFAPPVFVLAEAEANARRQPPSSRNTEAPTPAPETPPPPESH